MHSFTRPDFREADMHSTADDFETAAQFIAADSRALTEARSALKAATGHLRPDSNAAVLCENAIACIDGTRPPGEPTREELIAALANLSNRYKETHGELPYTPEGAAARELLNRLTP